MNDRKYFGDFLNKKTESRCEYQNGSNLVVVCYLFDFFAEKLLLGVPEKSK